MERPGERMRRAEHGSRIGRLARWLLRLRYGRRLPQVSGELRLAGPRAPIRILRDDCGIPTIQAESDLDAWYGLGFCQGQDRAFQLELLLRLARGSLAELGGAGGLPSDRLARRIGFRRAAERQLAELDAAQRRGLEAFALGLRAGATRGCPRPAHEFALLGLAPTPYAAADTLATAMLLSFLLESNWGAELARLLILSRDGPEALLALDPLCVLPPEAAGHDLPAAARLAEEATTLATALGLTGGSNVWALAGTRTASGRPLLANDPHLGPTLPPHWYLAHLATPAWRAAGACLVGTPAIAAGHNGRVAWGVTAALADNTDLYIEQLGPDGRSVRCGEAFVPCETRREVIRVKGGQTQVEEVLITPRGPLIGPALEGEMGAISLQASWLAPRAREGLFELQHADSVAELRRRLALGSGISLNVVCADTQGSLAWQMVGDLPRRRSGWGTLPRPGWLARTGWEADPLDAAALPHALDPPEGILVNANNPPPDAAAFGYTGMDWLDSYRFTRISEVLVSRRDWCLADMQALQEDRVSLPWRELRSLLLALPRKDPAARQALALLEAWDGVVAPESSAATIFQLFLAEMARRVAEAKAPRSARWVLGQGFTPFLPTSVLAVRGVGTLSELLRRQPAGWFARPWPEVCAEALAQVVRDLRRRHGRRPQRWGWGRLRPLVLRHPVSRRRWLAAIFDLHPGAFGGDTNTVCQVAVNPLAPLSAPLYLPSLRLVLDVGAWEACRFALPGGQSGNPLSPHYADLLTYWQAGQGVPIAWSEAEVERRARACLHLLPEADGRDPAAPAG